MASENRSQRIMEVLALADVLWFLPRPARRPIADKLHGLGVRVHPQLATLKVETDGPAHLSNVAPQHVVAIDKKQGLEVLRGMANQTGDHYLANLADRIEDADTEQKMAAERARLAPKIPSSLKTVEDHLDQAGDSIE